MKCAFYEKEITPPLGSDMPGNYNSRFAEGVEDRLYVKAAVFAGDEAGPEETVALVVLDTESLEPEFCAAVVNRASAFTGIPKDHIAVCATHAHTAIPKGDIGGYTIKDEIYMTLLERLAGDCVTLAYQRLETCTLRYGIGHEERVAFNRDYVLKDGSIVTNPGKRRGEIVRPYAGIDPDLPVLSAWNEAGTLMGMIYTYAMHQDTVGKLKYSGDYSSEIALEMKRQYGSDAISIYLVGCCGDINHVNFQSDEPVRTHRQIGQILAKEIGRVLKTESKENQGSDVAAGRREFITKRRHATEAELTHARLALDDPETYRKPHESEILLKALFKYVEDNEGTDYTMLTPIHVLRIGDVYLYVMPGELYHQFGEMIKQESPGDNWLICTRSNCYLGYVAIEELYGTDIYPAMLRSVTCIEPTGGRKLVDAAIEVAKEL